ncbi:hypothetical protein [Bradyrhizobium sp. JYMT SZCCT0180]|uniref:hypothetical protein n=1 Tax=Bradyrhizobium sp. JYMT SZCCT0180 TaxID=2807666 RepID=UPI001BACF7DE|nr:hypothetical protein [Bradyrhizobium sp. JYMT SZCCT0180]MBR1211298.1 hypothetical protein [Bradyrhizobium sp. JYMT SZCCT0180]
MNLLDQAFRAERLARSILDERTSEALLRYAQECREKAAHIAGPAQLMTARLKDAALQEAL